eukprot:5217400-Prymnesium_polylepis.1
MSALEPPLLQMQRSLNWQAVLPVDPEHAPVIDVVTVPGRGRILSQEALSACDSDAVASAPFKHAAEHAAAVAAAAAQGDEP